MPHTPEPTLAADLLRNARWMVGLTQAEVAQRAGVTQQTIAQYERGRRQPSLTTLDQLIAGCGLSLRFRLCPEPGLADLPTVKLLALEPLARIDARLREAVLHLATPGDAPAFVIGGKLAARLNGADVRVGEAEIWVAPGADIAVVADWLNRAGVTYVSPDGDVDPVAEVVSRERLRNGCLLVCRSTDLRLTAIEHFRDIHDRAMRLVMPVTTGALRIASADDCDRFWSDRDLDHLAMQRAVRLAGGRQAIRDAHGGSRNSG
jgi:transcriptional regulator with XRE-family HTH domain